MIGHEASDVALARGLERRPHIHWLDHLNLAWNESEDERGSVVPAVALAEDSITLTRLKRAPPANGRPLDRERRALPHDARPLIDDDVEIR